MELLEAIKIIRLQKSINQQVIADALNLDVAVVSNIENGKARFEGSKNLR